MFTSNLDFVEKIKATVALNKSFFCISEAYGYSKFMLRKNSALPHGIKALGLFSQEQEQ